MKTRTVVALFTAISLISPTSIVLADNYYFRARAPELGISKTISVSVTGETAGKIGEPLQAQVVVNGGFAPFVYSVSAGSLPPGIALNHSTGSISGTPTSVGTFPVSLAVVGAKDSHGSTSLSIDVSDAISITLPSSLSATVGEPISLMFAANGGDGKYSWTVSGKLPDGISLNGNALVGRPLDTSAGIYSDLTISVRDGSGLKTSRTFSLHVKELTAVVNSSTANLSLRDLFNYSDWRSFKAKRVIIPKNVVIYSDDASLPALSSSNLWLGTLTLQIDAGAEIQGASGQGSEVGVGKNGGTAIAVSQGNFNIENQGAILAGGGGGGAGGLGANGTFSDSNREPETGSYLSTSPVTGCYRRAGSNNTELSWIGKGIVTVVVGTATPPVSVITRDDYTYFCGNNSVRYLDGALFEVFRVRSTDIAKGGVGGRGGDGQGHNRSKSSGAIGRQGDVNAGTGGTGGNGGGWGENGSNGAMGNQSNIQTQGSIGFSGGLPGIAIDGPVNYSGQGLRLGR